MQQGAKPSADLHHEGAPLIQHLAVKCIFVPAHVPALPVVATMADHVADCTLEHVTLQLQTHVTAIALHGLYQAAMAVKNTINPIVLLPVAF